MSTIRFHWSSGPVVLPIQAVSQQEIRNINIRGVPECVWQNARQQALTANQPFKVWIINLLAECQPCPKTRYLTLPEPVATRTVNVRDVPEAVWHRAKAHAIASGLSLRDFVIALLAASPSQGPLVPASTRLVAMTHLA